MKKNIIFLFAVLLFLTVFALTNSGASIVFETEWGTQGNADGQFDTPEAVAIDAAGNVYVADDGLVDTLNCRIQKFDANGTHLTSFGVLGNGVGQFNRAKGVTVGGDGSIYVLEDIISRIQRFNTDCTYITYWGSTGSTAGKFDYPYAIAQRSTSTSGATVTLTSDMYVADANNDRIQRFRCTYTTCTTTTVTTRTSGTYVTAWGSLGTTDGLFDEPWGVAVDNSGNVFVSDTYNYRIQKFSAAGTFIKKWGSNGTAIGEFKLPRGLATDSSGNVYVCDSNNHRIQKFDTNGTYITSWGSNGAGQGQFAFPRGIAISSAGKIYVADMNNHRIQRFGEVPDPPIIPPVVPGVGYLQVVGGMNGYVNTAKGDNCLIRYQAGLAGEVKISIFNSSGVLVKSLSDNTPLNDKSIITVTYDCKDGDGKYLSSGIYTVKITGPALSAVKKFGVAR